MFTAGFGTLTHAFAPFEAIALVSKGIRYGYALHFVKLPYRATSDTLTPLSPLCRTYSVNRANLIFKS